MRAILLAGAAASVLLLAACVTADGWQGEVRPFEFCQANPQLCER